MCAPAASLAALEVAVGGGGAALAGGEDVGIHAQTHRAAVAAPVEAGRTEHLIQTLMLSLTFNRARPGHAHRLHRHRRRAAPDHSVCPPQLVDAGFGARAE